MLYFKNVVDYVTKYSELDYTLENDKIVIKDYYKNKPSERKAFEQYVEKRGVQIHRLLSFHKVPQDRYEETIEKIAEKYKRLGLPLEEAVDKKRPDYKISNYLVPGRLHTIEYYKTGSFLISGEMDDVAGILRFRPNLKEFIEKDVVIIEVEERDGKPIGERVKAFWKDGFGSSTNE